MKLSGGGSSSYLKAVLPTNAHTTNDNVSFELELVGYNTSTSYYHRPQMALYNSSYTSQGAVTSSNSKVTSDLGTTSVDVRNSGMQIGEVMKITREDGKSKLYIDDTLLHTVTRSVDNFRFGFYTTSQRWNTIKNIKVKQL